MADGLAGDVTERMQELAMSGGAFRIDLDMDQESQPSGRGRDRVDFMVSANPGHEPGSLSRVASGGELSRIALALKVAVCRTAP